MNNKKPLIAVAIFNDKKIKGRVYFRENPAENNIIIDLNLQGLKKNFRHGFHCHESGEIEENCCETVCKHFNPYKKNHGGLWTSERHVGDLSNNIETDNTGCASYSFTDNLIKLRGSKCNIIGRSVVIHEMTDDEGLGDNAESLITGNAGKKMACAPIVWAKENFL